MRPAFRNIIAICAPRLLESKRGLDKLPSLFNIFGDKTTDALARKADGIIDLKPSFESLSNAALNAKTQEFRARLARGESEDSILPEAYATVREAARRVLGMEPYKVQLIGGIALHEGKIAQMNTGEGKTLVATLPSYLNALSGKGVHVVTVNDYLAQRDRDLMGKVHEFLGLSVGVVTSGIPREARKAAYACDITYVTNSELGFDYLRDNMAMTKDEIVQRGLNYAIIDEIDSILIDDARTPLIISGEGRGSNRYYEASDVLAKRMTRGGEMETLTKMDHMAGVTREETGDFMVMEKERRVILTEEGMARTERFYRIENIADLDNVDIMHHMDVALRANYIMERDKDYIVRDGDVFIVDANTGRAMPGRRYSDGLHQAIEAKEAVHIQRENATIATITYQSFFNKYAKKSGMTGTAGTESKEFQETYELDVVPIPPNVPVRRLDHHDLVFKTHAQKIEAIIDEVEASHRAGRPVLVGTESVDASEEISQKLHRRGIPHNVLNAKQDEQEAQIVAAAGKRGAVTIATNMAGRGTDIKLDDQAKELGGLLVIGAQRHDARRIDDQLIGRAGRQGDPGETRFYLSLDDYLLRLFDDGGLTRAFDSASSGSDAGITSGSLEKAVRQIQKAREATHHEERKQLQEYDKVIDAQREVIYDQRMEVLREPRMRPIIENLIDNVAEDVAEDIDQGNLEGPTSSYEELAYVFAPQEMGNLLGMETDEAKGYVRDRLLKRYAFIREAFSNEEMLDGRARYVLLEAVDGQWADHIDDMEQLKRGIGLVTYGKQDPVVEFSRISSEIFSDMTKAIRMDAVLSILCTEREARAVDRENRQRAVAEAREAAASLANDAATGKSNDAMPSEDGDAAGANALLLAFKAHELAAEGRATGTDADSEEPIEPNASKGRLRDALKIGRRGK